VQDDRADQALDPTRTDQARAAQSERSAPGCRAVELAERARRSERKLRDQMQRLVREGRLRDARRVQHRYVRSFHAVLSAADHENRLRRVEDRRSDRAVVELAERVKAELWGPLPRYETSPLVDEPVSLRPIAKKSGGYRLVQVFRRRRRVMNRLCARAAGPFIPNHPDVYAIKGNDRLAAAEEVRRLLREGGYTHAVVADVSNAYGSVSQAWVREGFPLDRRLVDHVVLPVRYEHDLDIIQSMTEGGLPPRSRHRRGDDSPTDGRTCAGEGVGVLPDPDDATDDSDGLLYRGGLLAGGSDGSYPSDRSECADAQTEVRRLALDEASVLMHALGGVPQGSCVSDLVMQWVACELRAAMPDGVVVLVYKDNVIGLTTGGPEACAAWKSWRNRCFGAAA